MGLVSTKAIVISSLKYSNSSLIVKCYTEEEGVKSYLIRGVLKAKKTMLRPAYFQPLTQLNLIVNHSIKRNLHTIRELQILNPYKTIHTDIVKQSIVLFLSEILSNCIQEEEKNPALYEYLETSLIWLDLHHKVVNFHLLFLLNLTRFLGFYPDISNQQKRGFNLIEGNFTDAIHEKNVISGNNFFQFKRLLGMHFDIVEDMSFRKEERQALLQTIIQYFELHLDGFRKPKSLTILETVFS